MKAFFGSCAALVLLTTTLNVHPLLAQASEIGSWLRQSGPGVPGDMTMTITEWGKGGRKLTYGLATPGGPAFEMIIESPLDGSDSPVLVNGQPSGQTMGIKRVDAHHLTAVLKFNGTQYGASHGTFSPDFKTLTVENEVTKAMVQGMPVGKTTETWVKK